MTQDVRNPSSEDTALWRERIRRDAFGRYHLEMGIAIAREGNLPAAEAALRRAIDIEPDLTDSYFHLARVLDAQDRRAEAEGIRSQGHARNSAYASLALCRLALRRIEEGGDDKAAAEVLSLLDAADTAGPRLSGSAVLRAITLHSRGRSDDALALLAEALSLPPLGDPDMTAALGWMVLRIANGYERLGQNARAETLARQALALDAGTMPAYSLLAGVLLERGALDEAAALIDAGLGIQPADADLLGYRGVLLGRLSRMDEAEASLRDAVERQPDNPWLLGHLGQVLNARGCFAEAAALLEQAVGLDPERGWLLGQWGMARRMLGQPAAGLLARALAQTPGDPWTLQQLGAARLDEGLDGPAMTAFRQALAVSPALSWPFVQMGIAAFKAGHMEASKALFRRAAHAEPNNGTVQAQQALPLVALGRVEEARGVCQAVLNTDPGIGWVHGLLGAVSLRLDLSSPAGLAVEAPARAFQRACLTEGRRSGGDPLTVLAMIRFVLPGPGDAERALNLLVGTAPDWLDSWRGLLHLAAGESGGLELIRAAVDTQPDAPDLRALLSLGLLHRGDIVGAEAAAEHAISLASGGPWHTYRGLVRLAQGRLNEAEADHRTALARFPGFLAAWIHLAAVLQAMGRAGDARSAYRIALARQMSGTDNRTPLLPGNVRRLIGALGL